MMIDEDGEVSGITEEDFKRAIKNPYAKIMYRAGTVIIDAEVLEYFKELAEKKGIYHGKLISETLKQYIANSEQIRH